MKQTANLALERDPEDSSPADASEGRATLDARATLTTVTVVGEPATSGAYHALRDELGWLGFHARTAPVASLKPNASPVVALGEPALDGGVALRAALGPRAMILVVLPEDSFEARLEAYRVGARPITSGDEATIAAGVVGAIADSPSPVGWTSLGALMDATRARLGASLGTGREARAKLRFDRGAALAAAVERFAADIERLCVESQTPAPTPVKVDGLTWDDEPETRQQDALQRARFLALAAEREATAPDRMHRGPILGGLAKTGRPKDAKGTWSRSSVPPPMQRPTVVPDEDDFDGDALGTHEQKTVAAPALGGSQRPSSIREKSATAGRSQATFPKPQPSLLPCFEDDVTHGGGSDAPPAKASLPAVLEPTLAERTERATVPERARALRPASLPPRDALVPEPREAVEVEVDAPLDSAPLDGAPADAAPLDTAPLDAAPLDAAPLDGALLEAKADGPGADAPASDVFAAPAMPAHPVAGRRSRLLWPLLMLVAALAAAGGLALIFVLTAG